METNSILRSVCINGWFPVAMIFVIGTIFVGNDIRDSFGVTYGNLIIACFLMAPFFISALIFSNVSIKAVVPFYLIFVGSLLIFYRLGSNSDDKLERLQRKLDSYQSAGFPKLSDPSYSAKVEHLSIEKRAIRLEILAAKLRQKGPEEFYGTSFTDYLLIPAIIVVFGYATLWIFYLLETKKRQIIDS